MSNQAVRLRNLRTVLGAAVAVLLLGVSFAPVAGANAPAPTPQQVVDVFQDEWGPADFEPTGVSFWEEHSVWRRVDQYRFAPGTTELTGQPVHQTDLRPQRLAVQTREAHGVVEYNVIERTTRHNGTIAANWFPSFQGTPVSMVFDDALGARDEQKSCRDLVKNGRHFLVCRVIRDDGAIFYNTRVRQGESATGLPSQSRLLDAFQDQWGRVSFPATGVTAWRPVSEWLTESGVIVPEGETEFTTSEDEYVVVTPGVDATTLDWTFFRRFVDGVPEHQMSFTVIQPGEDEALLAPFAPFSGDLDDNVTQDEVAASVGGPPDGERRHSRIVRFNGEDFLIIRVVHSNGIVNYWVNRRIG